MFPRLPIYTAFIEVDLGLFVTFRSNIYPKHNFKTNANTLIHSYLELAGLVYTQVIYRSTLNE